MDYMTYILQADLKFKITKQEFDFLIRVDAMLKPLKSSLQCKPLDKGPIGSEMHLTQKDDYGIAAYPFYTLVEDTKKKHIEVWVKHTMIYQNVFTLRSISVDYETDLGKHLLEEWYCYRYCRLADFKQL